MNPEVKAEWVAALRSGEYMQTKGHLKDSNGMCCLGVLCDIAAKHEPGWKWEAEAFPDTNGDDCYEFTSFKDDHPYTSNSVLPWPVKRWADLRDENPRIAQLLDDTGDAVSIASLNDGNKGIGVEHHTFAQIADIIEKYL